MVHLFWPGASVWVQAVGSCVYWTALQQAQSGGWRARQQNSIQSNYFAFTSECTKYDYYKDFRYAREWSRLSYLHIGSCEICYSLYICLYVFLSFYIFLHFLRCRDFPIIGQFSEWVGIHRQYGPENSHVWCDTIQCNELPYYIVQESAVIGKLQLIAVQFILTSKHWIYLILSAKISRNAKFAFFWCVPLKKN